MPGQLLSTDSACVCVLQSNNDLESVRVRLSNDVVKSSEEQRRLSLMVQGLEASKAGLQRRLSV